MIRSLTAAALAGGLLLLAPLPRLDARTDDTAPAAADEAAPLERALGTIRPERISADLHFLASDEMGGRDTPSKGLEVAAQFLRARLERLGFTPGAGDGWFFEYPLDSTALVPERCTATWSTADGEHELALASEYWLGTARVYASDTHEGAVVSVGEGDRDDFDGLELDGAWALVLDREGDWMTRVARDAERAGAVGLLVAQSADYEGEPLAERFGDERFERLLQGKVVYPREGEEREPRQRTPIVYLERAASDLLLASCQGYDPEADDWFPPSGAATGVRFRETRTIRGALTMKNVCGLWPGDDPELSDEVFLVSAHYDHVGEQGDEVFNGADDNGSGTSGLLAVAEALAAYGPMDRSVLLIWVSGEEKGLWGSRAWADDPLLPEGHRAVADLNMDMIGRNDPNELFLTPSPDHKRFNAISAAALRLAPREGFPRLDSADDYYHRSDQAQFARLEIPVAFLFAGIHEDYHRPTDTADKIDYEKLSRVVRLVVRLLDDLQDAPLGE